MGLCFIRKRTFLQERLDSWGAAWFREGDPAATTARSISLFCSRQPASGSPEQGTERPEGRLTIPPSERLDEDVGETSRASSLAAAEQENFHEHRPGRRSLRRFSEDDPLHESIGLITPPVRAQSGYRVYQGADLHMLRFVKKGRARSTSLSRKRLRCSPCGVTRSAPAPT
jgi:hypothetical protein